MSAKIRLKIRVEPKVDGLGTKWMVISHGQVKVGWIKVAVHFEPL